MALLANRRAFLSLLTAGAALPLRAISGKRAPDFTTETMVGKRLRLADFKGKTLILTFWATWCPHCRRQIAVMEKIYRDYADKKVEFLALSVDQEGWDKVGKYISDNKLTLPIGLAQRGTAAEYGASQGIPLTVVIDENSNLLGGQPGALNEELLRMIAEKYAPGA